MRGRPFSLNENGQRISLKGDMLKLARSACYLATILLLAAATPAAAQSTYVVVAETRGWEIQDHGSDCQLWSADNGQGMELQVFALRSEVPSLSVPSLGVRLQEPVPTHLDGSQVKFRIGEHEEQLTLVRRRDWMVLYDIEQNTVDALKSGSSFDIFVAGEPFGAVSLAGSAIAYRMFEDCLESPARTAPPRPAAPPVASQQ